MLTENGRSSGTQEPVKVIENFVADGETYGFPVRRGIGKSYTLVGKRTYTLVFEPECGKKEWWYMATGEPTNRDLLFLKEFAEIHFNKKYKEIAGV